MSAGPPAENGTIIFTGLVGYPACANTPVATHVAKTAPETWRSNLLKAMISSS
jgi:hypothetical protein